MVRYAGEPVAVVVAADRYLARDAADAIVVDVRSAAGRRRSREGDDRASRRVIHKDFPNNLAVALVPSGTGVAPDFSTIDNTAVDKAFADAEVVIIAAHGEPSPGAERDGAARRGRALRAGQGAR